MKIHPPKIVEATRGPLIESRHEVDIVVADAAGTIHSVFGDKDRPVFPRSANKALQALALVESGAAQQFGFTDRHLALACASHNGEERHTQAAGEMLALSGLDATCLECGAHWPKRHEDQVRLIEAGHSPGAIHNNCSGKHSGFLAFAVHQGFAPTGYVRFAHKVQRAIAGILEEVTGARHGENNHGIDGCSIPTYAIPLENLAVAFAKFGVGRAGGPERAKAMIRLRDACFAHPEMVAGTGRSDTAIMGALKGRAFTKTGAEGVFVAALPKLGLGIALKARDGATRAAEAAVAATMDSLLELSEEERKALAQFSNPAFTNWTGIEVGKIGVANSP